MAAKANYRTYYYKLGVLLDEHGSQLIGQCPLCDKQGHFYVDPETGQYKCKRCAESGNNYTMLKHVIVDTTDDEAEELAYRS